MTARFTDRRDAGQQLSRRLLHLVGTDAIVLALPRGGVPVADEIARALALPLDICLVRKVGAPGRPELGLGAVAEGGVVVIDWRLASRVGAARTVVEAIAQREADEVKRRGQQFRGERPPADVAGKTAIVVDDGVATGGTVTAAVTTLRRRGAGRIVVASPVAAAAAAAALRKVADDVVCVLEPPELVSVGAWYEDFHQVPDAVVVQILDEARTRITGDGTAATRRLLA